ncbi:uncharacterized protein ARMOST_06960 [Armillaria ostoyae]|uniref:Tf2-1-like SH3-like domain-containing protein n=1 Tax=Armillaria ostoyae TaxID=47428 RepID=A0A284R4F9_ARMOS|nr:uncharacterized protein ARMOST_06960 [Armillaria ostoyae]
MAKIHKETEAALEEAAGRMKKQYDKNKHDTRNYSTRDLKKLDDKHVGPFEILKKTGASAYKLKLPPHWKIHPCFNKKLLTPYVPLAFPNQEQPPPPLPDLIDREEQWEIEEILNLKMRKDNSDVYYLAQRNNGTQKWVKNPDETLWKEFLDEYWASQADAQYESPPEEP